MYNEYPEPEDTRLRRGQYLKTVLENGYFKQAIELWSKEQANAILNTPINSSDDRENAYLMWKAADKFIGFLESLTFEAMKIAKTPYK